MTRFAQISLTISVSRRLKRWFPWIALAITLVLLGWGAQRSGVAESWKFILAGPANEDTDIEEIGASDSFTVVGPKRYLSDNEIDALLDEAEAVRAELIEFLQIPEPESTITLRVRPQDGLTDTAGHVPSSGVRGVHPQIVLSPQRQRAQRVLRYRTPGFLRPGRSDSVC